MTARESTLHNFRAAQQARVVQRALELEDFLRLYDVYYDRVLYYMRYRCPDLQTAEDLTSRTFERALDRLHQYQADRAPFGAWLFGIARNLVNDSLRAGSKSECLPLEHIRNHPCADPTPEETLIQSELQTRLVDAMVILTERERDILAQKFGAQLSNIRIAEITGLTAANVGVIAYRCLRKLRLSLDEVEIQREPR